MGWYPCCCQDCAVATDDFDRNDGTNLGDDWTETAGDWSINWDVVSEIGSAQGDGAGSILIHDYADTEANVIVESLVSSSCRLLADYVDANNYAYAEYDHSASKIKVGRRAGGTDTDIADADFTSVGFTFRLCINGTTITALALSSVGGGIEAVASGTTTAATAGRQCGLMQTTSTATLFGYFTIKTPTASSEDLDECRCPTTEPDDCCCGQWWDPVADATVDLTELAITNGDWCDNCEAIAAVWDLPYAGPDFPCQWSVLEDWCDFDADAFRLEYPAAFTCQGTGPWVFGISLTYESSGSDCIITVTLNMAPTDVECNTEPDTFPSWSVVYRKTFTPDGDCGGEHTLDRVSAETLDHYSCGITFPATIPVTIPEPNAPIP